MLNTPGALLLFRAALGAGLVSVGEEERPEMAESTLDKSDVSADIVCEDGLVNERSFQRLQIPWVSKTRWVEEFVGSEGLGLTFSHSQGADRR